jgi:hypothetical protein
MGNIEKQSHARLTPLKYFGSRTSVVLDAATV